MLTHTRTEEFKRAAVEGVEVAEDRQRRARLTPESVCTTLSLDGGRDLITRKGKINHDGYAPSA